MKSKKRYIPKDRPFDCPDCGNTIEFVGVAALCDKCGSEFKKKISVYIKPHEYQNPKEWAQAHIRAAKTLLASLPPDAT